jgi:hypothetical protein
MSGWTIGRKRDNVHGTKGVSGPSPDAPGMWTQDSCRTRGAPRCTAAGRSSPGGNLSPGQSAGTSLHASMPSTGPCTTLRDDPTFTCFCHIQYTLQGKVYIHLRCIYCMLQYKLQGRCENMQQFTKAGRITRDRQALRVEIDGWQLGQLVIGRRGRSETPKRPEVDVNFVQQRDGREPFIGHAGTAVLSGAARRSTSGSRRGS